MTVYGLYASRLSPRAAAIAAAITYAVIALIVLWAATGNTPAAFRYMKV